MGKPCARLEEEIAKCARGCRFYAENAEEFLATRRFRRTRRAVMSATSRSDPSSRSCRGIFLSGRSSVSPRRRLMAGNVALLKHAGERSAMRAGDRRYFSPRRIRGRRFSDVAHRDGANARPDRRSAREGGHAHRQRTRRERSGERRRRARSRRACSNWAEAIRSSSCRAPISKRRSQTGVTARMHNTGQSCIAAKRFILADQIYDRFVSSNLSERMRALKVGDPLDASDRDWAARDGSNSATACDEQVQKSIAAGAKLAHRREANRARGIFL